MVVHCFAGISRSTAAAYVAACALNPTARRKADRLGYPARFATAQPNARIVSHRRPPAQARRPHGARGRSHRPGDAATEGHPFRLDLDSLR